MTLPACADLTAPRQSDSHPAYTETSEAAGPADGGSFLAWRLLLPAWVEFREDGVGEPGIVAAADRAIAQAKAAEAQQ